MPNAIDAQRAPARTGDVDRSDTSKSHTRGATANDSSVDDFTAYFLEDAKKYQKKHDESVKKLKAEIKEEEEEEEEEE